MERTSKSVSDASLVRAHLEFLESGPSAIEKEELQSAVVKFHLALDITDEPSATGDHRRKLMQVFRDEKRFSSSAGLESVKLSEPAETRPSTIKNYIRLASLGSEAKRKDEFLKLFPSERKSIWRTRLAVHLAIEPLTHPQQDMVLELASIMSDPALYSETRSTAFQAKLDDFEKRARDLFGVADTFRLFMSVGSDSVCPVATPGEGGIDNPEIETGNCTCYYNAYCSMVNEWTLCRTGGCSSVNNCGILGYSECIGTCRS